ncbi:MAG: hypothetical protein OXG35_21010 [Acidobacteria bacterium]|nr:hypothetical protein [Acidobacteriota bacterium]
MAHPDFWRRNRWNTADLAACPGRRILILGNHDIQDAERLRHVGFTRQHWAALLPTDPMLALTHLPLKRRPVPAWNVHGHIHGAEPPSPRHINVSVERTDYQPLRLAELIRKAVTPGPRRRGRRLPAAAALEASGRIRRLPAPGTGASSRTHES